MEESFTGGWYPELSNYENKKISREDFIANTNASRYAVAFDRRGRLGWKSSEIEDEDPGYGGAHCEADGEKQVPEFMHYLWMM